MQFLKMQRCDLPQFLDNLKSYGELWAPIKGENVWNKDRFDSYQNHNLLKNELADDSARWHYRQVDDPSPLDLDFHSETKRTVLPPKQFIHPPQFGMFSFSGGDFNDTLDEVPNRVIFGPHPCDINGMLILDEFFTRDYPDPYYLKRREKTLIIGTSCVPDENCLAKYTGTHTVEQGFDLFFTDLEDFYLVRVGSQRGSEVANSNFELFDPDVSRDDLNKFIQWRKWRNSQYSPKLDIEEVDIAGMPELMDLSWNSPVWEKIGNKCLACGTCTMVCPTCNCYNLLDELNLSDELKGSRIRCWDSCTLREYSSVAGGENFRQTRQERLKLWYTHKLEAYLSERGNYACVGCGRCVVSCPVDINVLTVAKGLLGKPVEAFWAKGEVK